MTPEEEELLRRFSINDETVMLSVLGSNSPRSGLGQKVDALTRLAALIARNAGVSSYHWAIDDAIAGGATDAEIIGVLLTVAPIVGLASVASAAPRLALALGYDVEQALG